MKNSNRVILVLGVDHSGTSVLTKGLETMGVSLGPALTRPKPFEQEEIWEDPDFHTLNLEMLFFFGAHLRGIVPLTEEEVEILCNAGFLEKASQLLLKKLPKDQPLGIKDPRFSILLPFWKKVFQACQITLSCVIALRNPWKVAISQKQQHLEKSFWGWISYLLSCLEHSEGYKRLVVNYEELLHNPAYQMQRVANVLKLPLDPETLELYCKRYVDSSRPHARPKKGAEICHDFYQHFAIEIYDQLLRVAKEEIEIGQLKDSFKKWKQHYLEAHSLLVLAEKNHQRIEALEEKIRNLDASIHQLHKTMNQQSYSIAHYCQQVHQRDLKIASLLQERREHNASPNIS